MAGARRFLPLGGRKKSRSGRLTSTGIDARATIVGRLGCDRSVTAAGVSFHRIAARGILTFLQVGEHFGLLFGPPRGREGLLPYHLLGVSTGSPDYVTLREYEQSE